MENIGFPVSPAGVGFSAECVSPIPTALAACLLLAYPIRKAQVHPFMQIAICACLTAVGLSLAVSRLICTPTPGECSSCNHWIMAASTVLSLSTVIVPSVGAIVGLSTASGLVANAVATNFCSGTVTEIIVILAAAGGFASLFLSRGLFLQWQLIAPPIVGGYLGTLASGVGNPTFRYGLWVGLAAVSLGFHLRRRQVNTWLEQKQQIAVHSKESQIVGIMRSANPHVPVDEFEKMQEKLLQVVDGDREQADRIIYGGGLY